MNYTRVPQFAQGGQQQQMMQMVQAFAQQNHVDPQQVMQALQSGKLTIEQIEQALGQQEAPQQEAQESQPQMMYGGVPRYGVGGTAIDFRNVPQGPTGPAMQDGRFISNNGLQLAGNPAQMSTLGPNNTHMTVGNPETEMNTSGYDTPEFKVRFPNTTTGESSIPTSGGRKEFETAFAAHLHNGSKVFTFNDKLYNTNLRSNNTKPVAKINQHGRVTPIVNPLKDWTPQEIAARKLQGSKVYNDIPTTKYTTTTKDGNLLNTKVKQVQSSTPWMSDAMKDPRYAKANHIGKAALETEYKHKYSSLFGEDMKGLSTGEKWLNYPITSVIDAFGLPAGKVMGNIGSTGDKVTLAADLALPGVLGAAGKYAKPFLSKSASYMSKAIPKVGNPFVSNVVSKSVPKATEKMTQVYGNNLTKTIGESLKKMVTEPRMVNAILKNARNPAERQALLDMYYKQLGAQPLRKTASPALKAAARTPQQIYKKTKQMLSDFQ